jgi:hypothetical protein
MLFFLFNENARNPADILIFYKIIGAQFCMYAL